MCGHDSFPESINKDGLSMNSTRLRLAFASASVSVLLVGCGGTANVNTAPVIPTYVKTSTILLNEEKIVDAMSVGVDISGVIVLDSSVRRPDVTNLTQGSIDYSSQAKFTYNNDGTIKKISVVTANESMTWENSAMMTNFVEDTFGMGILIAANKPAELRGNVALFVNPAVTDTINYNYQTFGFWTGAEDFGDNTWSGYLRAMSVGTPTAGVSIPTSGNSTFRGYTTGVFHEPSVIRVTASELIINADHLTRNVTFVTTNTYKGNGNTRISADELNMTGSLTYTPATNTITGGAVTANGMAGSASGRFYGPSADEIGGVFLLDDGSITSYIGSFGGKQ